MPIPDTTCIGLQERIVGERSARQESIQDSVERALLLRQWLLHLRLLNNRSLPVVDSLPTRPASNDSDELTTSCIPTTGTRPFSTTSLLEATERFQTAQPALRQQVGILQPVGVPLTLRDWSTKYLASQPRFRAYLFLHRQSKAVTERH